MNNKKYFIDISLEIEASDLSQTEDNVLVVTKEDGDQKIVLHLPVVGGETAQGFKDDQLYDHYWNAFNDNGRQGFWLREKEDDMKSGLELLDSVGRVMLEDALKEISFLKKEIKEVYDLYNGETMLHAQTKRHFNELIEKIQNNTTTFNEK